MHRIQYIRHYSEETQELRSKLMQLIAIEEREFRERIAPIQKKLVEIENLTPATMILLEK